MDLKDQIKIIGERVTKLKEQTTTEEATKTAFIMPFIQALGYDVFNPLEVIPEFTCDIGTKKGEKIDYAIFKDDTPIILIECKHWKENIDLHDNQLLRYFNVSKAKFGLLTNGIIYRFYTDLDKQNVMDKKPFLEFDITAMKDYQAEELKKFHKSYFDVESIFNTASELKYTRELKKLINQEMNDPNPEFVKYFAKQVYPGSVTAKVLEQFTGLTKKSAQILISDLITERLNIAINKESEANEAQETIQESKDGHDVKIITTEEELEGYMIVKTILRQKIDVKRIVYRDSQTYFAILLDDNNRKTICRLYFNGKKKYFVILDENRKEIKTQIETLDNLFDFSNKLFEIVENYDNNG